MADGRWDDEVVDGEKDPVGDSPATSGRATLSTEDGVRPPDRLNPTRLSQHTAGRVRTRPSKTEQASRDEKSNQ